MKKYIVYKHIFPNNKIYIGITCQDPRRRWANGTGYKTQPYIYKAILKYKWENIKHEILFENLSKKEAEQKEMQLIKRYKSNDKRYGYNLANGGNTVGTVSEKTKQKISKSLKGTIPWNKGTHEINSGCFKKGNVPWIKGKKMPQEFIEKNRLGHLGQHSSPETEFKPKIVKCIETGIIYNGTKEASKITGIAQTSISKASIGRQKTAGGYHWKYISE